MKRHPATLARRCPTCCAPLGVVCVWPGRKTTHDVPHPRRLRSPEELATRSDTTLFPINRAARTS